MARTTGCVLILDEFYSHFTFDRLTGWPADSVSAARHVRDVNADPVLLLDGLTKNFRYPGWRLGWIVGPEAMIETIGRVASAIDGGPPTPVQRAALQILAPSRADRELAAMAAAFARKRTLMRGAAAEDGAEAFRRRRGHVLLLGLDRRPPRALQRRRALFSGRRSPAASSSCRVATSTSIRAVSGAMRRISPG